ncbi:hypothetical protein CASFOL_029848 [Castilleja foliolosa]|uniref:Bifunctional inhibitor/plant lipid transfer protein/seed storage helical domain-containing protein n=1 Tax=Castilleja foliolosa TaxID=1961234 RepID=A0ABD3CAA2_9LAMI
MAFKFIILALTIYTTILFFPASGQITAPCTPSMISTFSSCMSFVTNNSSFNGSTPPADCCNSINSLMTNGKECLCLIATGSVPFRVPINRTLAVSLPRSCNMPGVPLQCKTASGAPAPSPGLVANGPSFSPNAAPSPSVQELAPPEPLSPQSDPGADATQSPPAVTTASGGPATSNTGSRTGVTQSAAHASYGASYLHVMMALLGAVTLKYY